MLDCLTERWRARLAHQNKFQAQVALVEREGRRVLLCEPETFMNASGEAVQALAAFYRVSAERTLIVLDDADLNLGEIRLRPSGSSGGHHGLESLERHLGTRDYPRLRIGIGREQSGVREITDYVLSQFSTPDAALLEKVLARACDQVECWLREGITQAMNRFNGKIKEKVSE